SALVMRLRCPSLVVYHSFRDRRALHSFPTRRSSDLLALTNKRVVYDLLFRAATATLLQVAANPKRLGAAIGGLMVLHTWGQRLRSEEHTSELQSRVDVVCRLLLENKTALPLKRRAGK